MRRQIAWAVIVFAAVSGSSPTHAQFYTGNDILGWCSNLKALVTGYAAGLVEGFPVIVYDEEGILRTPKSPFCIPDGVTVSQVTDVICRAIDQEPASRHWPASSLAVAALSKAWPCL